MWEQHRNQNAQIFAFQVTLKLRCPQDAQKVAGSVASLSLPFPPCQHFCLSPELPGHATGCGCPFPTQGPPSSALHTSGCATSQRPQWWQSLTAGAVLVGLLKHFAPGWVAWEQHRSCLSCGVRCAAIPRAWGKGWAGWLLWRLIMPWRRKATFN